MSTAVLLTIITAYFIDRIRQVRPDVYEQIGRPTAFFFITGGWLTSGQFTKFLLGGGIRQALVDNQRLAMTARLISFLYLAVLTLLLMMVLTIFAGRLTR